MALLLSENVLSTVNTPIFASSNIKPRAKEDAKTQLWLERKQILKLIP